jgi:hypothetical protein
MQLSERIFKLSLKKAETYCNIKTNLTLRVLPVTKFPGRFYQHWLLPAIKPVRGDIGAGENFLVISDQSKIAGAT